MSEQREKACERLEIRLTPSENRAWREWAEVAKVPVGTFVKRVVNYWLSQPIDVYQFEDQ